MNPAIILVDDEAMVRALIGRIMHEAVSDYELIAVADGATALALFAERPIALVLTDQHMPDMDGVALTVAIKAVAPLCPVILITGSATREVRKRAEAARVDFLLLKPFGFEQLATIVRAMLAQ
jgi:two-component system chemotaxis response regulator CheY